MDGQNGTNFQKGMHGPTDGRNGTKFQRRTRGSTHGRNPKLILILNVKNNWSILKDSIGILILPFLIQVSSNQLNSDIFGQFWSCNVIMTSSQNFSKNWFFAASGSQAQFFTTKMFSLEYWAHTLSNAVSHDHFSSFWCKMVILTTHSEKWP